MPKFIQDELVDMYGWIAEYGYYGRDKDWTTGKKITNLNTFEGWLKSLDGKENNEMDHNALSISGQLIDL